MTVLQQPMYILFYPNWQIISPIKKKYFSRNRFFNDKTVTDYRAPIPKRKLYLQPPPPWGRQNIGILRHRAPGKTLPPVSEHRDTDYLGRSLEHPGYDFLKRAPVVIVSREGDKKIIQPPQDLMERPRW